MVDRQKVETILTRRFPGACGREVAAAANAIMGLGEEWEEIGAGEGPLQGEAAAACTGGCCLVHAINPDSEFRLFRRRDG